MMKVMFLFVRWLLCALLFTATTAQAYQSGDWIWRATMMQQQTSAGGDPLPAGRVGAQIRLGTEIMPALEFDYFVLDGLSVGIGLPIRRLSQKIFVEDDAGTAHIGRVETWPVTFSLNWYPVKIGHLRPYLIAAAQYNWVVMDHARQGAKAGIGNLELDNGVGVGGGLGLEWDRAGKWSWNLSATTFDMSQDARVYFGGNPVTLETALDPLTINFGISKRF